MPSALATAAIAIEPPRAPIDEDAAYLAWTTRDARFDGRVFVGVTSTGIYCRPVCRVRLPRRANMRFFGNAAAAQHAGFRPCLRCRPELAPGLSLVDSSAVLAQHAARMLEHAARQGEALKLPDIAARLGVTDRHLRRIFAATLGVTPIDYWTTQRLLLAKQLLTDTALPVADVAWQCGFSSQRRFNAAFLQHCRLSPSRLRRAVSEPAPAAERLRLRLGYRPPYDIDALMLFLAARALPGVEAVEHTDGHATLRRTLRLPAPSPAPAEPRGETGSVPSPASAGEGRGEGNGAAPSGTTGWIAVHFLPDRHELALQVAPSLHGALGRVIDTVRQAFDLDADPARIDPVLARLPVPARAGGRLPNGFCGFETAVRVILGQQVTVKAARTLSCRLVERFGTPIDTPFADLTRLFPTAAVLAAADPADIGTLGIVRQRVGAIQALARAVSAGTIALHRGAPLPATMDALRALPGIGEWTVQVIAMRALAWPDAWPATDIGLYNALGSREPKHIVALSEAWRPWRAYAVMRLWHSVENGT